MIRLKRFILLIMILLLPCFIGLSQSNDSIVETKQDSVLVPIDALRIANAKMIELKYEKIINQNLMGIIYNDSLIISALDTNLSCCEREARETISTYKRQRNRAIEIGGGTSIVLFVLLIIAL